MHQKMVLSSISLSFLSSLSDFKRERESERRERKKKKRKKGERRNLVEGKNCIQRHEMTIRVKMSFPFLVFIRLFVSFDVFLLSHFSPSGHFLSLTFSLLPLLVSVRDRRDRKKRKKEQRERERERENILKNSIWDQTSLFPIILSPSSFLSLYHFSLITLRREGNGRSKKNLLHFRERMEKEREREVESE